jgi:ABC-type uncharacterized transport system ATPase component
VAASQFRKWYDGLKRNLSTKVGKLEDGQRAAKSLSIRWLQR